MKYFLAKIYITLGLVVMIFPQLASAYDGVISALSEGTWYKIAITETGIYKIDYNTLQDWGVNPSSLNPNALLLLGNGGAILPQANSADRPVGIIENHISIIGAEDGSFDSEDYILFYGQGPNHLTLNSDGSLDYEHHIYTDTSFYYLRTDGTNGARISDKSTITGDFSKITTYNAIYAHESDETNILKSGRMWFGDVFTSSGSQPFELPFSYLLSEESKLQVQFLSQTYASSSMDITLGEQSIGEVSFSILSDNTYADKGSISSRSFNFTPNTDGMNTINFIFNGASGVTSRAYIDYFIFSGISQLRYNDETTFFRSIKSTESVQSTFEIDNTNDNCIVWDISDTYSPQNITTSYSDNKLTFNDITVSLNEYVVFDPDEITAPVQAEQLNNQNLYEATTPDLLIISPPEFISEAERLASFKSSFDGLNVLCVTTNQIYNEFASGGQDITAIRDFIRHLYQKGNESTLKNILLFGKGSYDYKNRLTNNTNFVPLYASENSVDPLDSYCSDDYYTFMDDDEGLWSEDDNGEHTMDIGIGRLPIKTDEEAANIVDKIINYEKNQLYGSWKNKAIFVADDGDSNSHMEDADQLADYIDTAAYHMLPEKIYIDAFEQEKLPSGQQSEEATEALLNAINDGTLVVNYSGHGSETRLADETIIDISTINELENAYLPLFVTATCEFGRHDNPNLICGAEYLINNPDGGAIGIITSSRLVYQNTNFKLNKALYEYLFDFNEGSYEDMGTIFKETKNNSIQNVRNRNFSYLGDPSLRLASPSLQIQLESESGYNIPGDTLYALEEVHLKGSIRNPDQSLNTLYNDNITVTVLGQPVTYTTLGDEDADNPATYQQRDNYLFNGYASVKEGYFEATFIMPKNIDYETGIIKISMYGYDEENQLDAGGADISFKLGAGGSYAQSDNDSPNIELYINDTTFVSGGYTGNDIVLLAKLSDESGINLSHLGLNQNISLDLDDSLSWDVNQYYTASTDTYTEGWINFSIEDLEEGTHTIKLTAYDVYNNASQSEIDFIVVGNGKIYIEKTYGIPNPFTTSTSIIMEHNRAGEAIKYSIEIINDNGQNVLTINNELPSSSYRQELIQWNGTNLNGARLNSGVYYYRITAQSLKDGTKMTRSGKLILMN